MQEFDRLNHRNSISRGSNKVAFVERDDRRPGTGRQLQDTISIGIAQRRAQPEINTFDSGSLVALFGHYKACRRFPALNRN
ncbi:MAG: hypothetical protein HYX27_06520 [Acidobacteria bacterium]|nr:hypothetical protein [Acidobacteriota bacterium]